MDSWKLRIGLISLVGEARDGRASLCRGKGSDPGWGRKVS